MAIHYYKAVQPKARTQSTRRRAPHVKMSKEAHVILNVRRRTVATQFHQEIDDTNDHLLKSAATIAEKHGKSLRNVQFSLSGGHGSLTHQHHNKSSAWNAWVWKNA
jgi:hypothetical protein